MHSIVKILAFSGASFLTLFIIAKILGKRQIAQLDFSDYVIGITIGSIAAEMATDLDSNPFYYYIIAMATLMALDILINFLSSKTPFLKRLLKGKPIVIIYEGKLSYKNLKKSKLDVNDLLSMLRELGYFDIKDIEYALFETSGKLSVMPTANQKPTVAENLNIELTPSKLPVYLIIDGRISYSGLTELNRDEKWLLRELKMKDKTDLHKIILASFDENTQKIVVNYKNLPA